MPTRLTELPIEIRIKRSGLRPEATPDRADNVRARIIAWMSRLARRTMPKANVSLGRRQAAIC